MWRVASKFVPRLLSVDQKQQRLDVCLYLKENAAKTPDFFRMPLRATKPGFTPTTRKPKLNPVNGKVRGHPDRRRQGKWEETSSQCWFVSFIRRELFAEFVSPCQTVNAAFYVEVLKSLRENVWRKRPDQWRSNTWLLHHDNAPAHAALLTRRFLTDNNMTLVPHPPYSPDLAHSDFFLFPKRKMKLKGWRFQTEEIQAEL